MRKFFLINIILLYLVCPHNSILIGSKLLNTQNDQNIPEYFNGDFKPDPPKDLNFTLYPVILIPGDGGNQIYARLNKSTAPHYLCKLKSSDYLLLWLNLEEIPPYVLDCFVDNMMLDYDNTTKHTLDRPGVDIKIEGFGETDTVEYLDPSRYSATGYYSVIVDALVKKYGHKRGKSIRGVPYDWRRSPNEFDGYYKNYKSLVEETYEMNNQTKVILLAHSMGNPVTLYFLNNYVNQAWKDTYIHCFVSLSAPWGGASKTIRLMTSGDNIDVYVVNPLTVRPYQRSATSTAFLMPSDKFWSANETFVFTPSKNYTIADYKQFFDDINFPTGYEYRKNTEHLTTNMIAPEVETHCLYGVGIKTPERFVFKKQKDFPDTQPAVIYGDGDGTVNLISMLGYRKWIGQSKPLYFKEIPGAEHVQILKSQAVIDYILKLFLN